jgi:hypothetical protein
VFKPLHVQWVIYFSDLNHEALGAPVEWANNAAPMFVYDPSGHIGHLPRWLSANAMAFELISEYLNQHAPADP